MVRFFPPPLDESPPPPPSSSPPHAATPIASMPTRQPATANLREFKETPPHKGSIWAAILRTALSGRRQVKANPGRLRGSGEPQSARPPASVARDPAVR